MAEKFGKYGQPHLTLNLELITVLRYRLDRATIGMMFFISTLEEWFSFLDNIKPNTIFYILLIFIWVVSLWKHYLAYRQYQCYKHQRTVPDELVDVMTIEELDRARSYAVDQICYNEIHSIFNQFEKTIILLTGAFPWLWEKSGHIIEKYNFNNYEILQSIVFISILMIYSTILNIPWSYYENFVLEERHGFNKQTIQFFIKDTIKTLLVTLVLVLPIASFLIKIIQMGGDYFFIYSWLFIITVSLILAFIYPNYIAPLFDRYDPLREGELRSNIEQLAAKINFPLSKIYVVEGSARSSHTNAYFYGFFKAKRIVLCDTLIKGYITHKSNDDNNEKTNEGESTLVHQKTVDNTKDRTKKKTDKGCESDEVLAILCHEFGHWLLNHNLINLSISFMNLFFVSTIFAALCKRSVLYQAFGFIKTKPIIMSLLIIYQYVLAPYFAIFSFASTALSRRFEFQADHYTVKLKHGDSLGRALKKLELDNMTYPYSDFLYAKYYYSHPTLLERLKAIERMKQN